jgi:4-hydroxybenzoate polyprenyltransferase
VSPPAESGVIGWREGFPEEGQQARKTDPAGALAGNGRILGIMSRVRAVTSRVSALVAASHPGPSVAVTAMAFLLTAKAAAHGTGPPLIAPAILAGQLSVGWSNDAIDAGRDTAAQRDDKPIATGRISARLTWTAAVIAAVAALALPLAISPATALICAITLVAAWAYNAGLKATMASGLPYIVAFGLLPAVATSTLPARPLPHWWITVIAATLGLGAHFANVLPDLAADRANGVNGLPQRIAAWGGERGVRAVAVTLLLAATVALAVTASPGRRWVAIAGVSTALILAVASATGRGKVPFATAIAIAGVNVVMFAAAGESLT